MATRRKTEGFEIYQSGGSRGDWFWRLTRRGRTIADGSEGYTRRADAIRAVKSVVTWLRTPMKVTVGQ